jgi:hypothetical protein
MHFFIISPLSFRAENNLDQWYQSRLLLIIFFSACPRRGPEYSKLGLELVSLEDNHSRTPKKPSMAEEKKNDRADDPINLLLEQALTRQRDEMMENFSHILQRLSITVVHLHQAVTLEAPRLSRYKLILIFLYLKDRSLTQTPLLLLRPQQFNQKNQQILKRGSTFFIHKCG